MAGNKEIRNKIKSVQNTQKITKAMEMVAASKMRKAQERMRQARPYAEKIRQLVARLVQANRDLDQSHAFMRALPTQLKQVGMIAISTDKGLCGGLNTNLLRLLTQKTKSLQEAQVKVQFATIGSKVTQFIARTGGQLSAQVTQLGDVPHLDKLLGIIGQQVQAFLDGELDAVYIVYTKFINTMKQEATIEQLLPVPESAVKQQAGYAWDYIYEPNALDVMDILFKRYIEALVYQSLTENMASEQSARMVAMKSASDNAKSVIRELQLEYNKTRQASITKELSEIVSGAAAV